MYPPLDPPFFLRSNLHYAKLSTSTNNLSPLYLQAQRGAIISIGKHGLVRRNGNRQQLIYHVEPGTKSDDELLEIDLQASNRARGDEFCAQRPMDSAPSKLMRCYVGRTDGKQHAYLVG